MKDNFLNKLLILTSGISTTILLTNLNANLSYVSIAIALIIYLFLVFKTSFVEKVNVQYKNVFLPISMSLLATIGFFVAFLWRNESEISILIVLLAIASYPFMYKIYKFVLWSFQEYKNSLLEYKKIFLYYSIWAVLIFIFTLFVFQLTSALNYPISIDGIKENNVIFGSDVGSFSGYKNHLFIGDQFRHPAFTVIMMPVLTLIYVVSASLSVVLDINLWVVFSLLHSGLQALTYSLIATMIFALLKKHMSEKVSFCGGLFYLSTFSTILYSSMIERFSFEIALLLIFIVFVINNNNERHQDFLFGVTSFSVVSSVAIYPIKFFGKKINLDVIKKTVKLGLYMLASLFLLGRGTILFSFGNDMQHNLRYAVGSVFDGKLLQYLSFESGLFTAPNWVVLYKDNYNFEFPAAKYGEFADGIIMQAYPQQSIYYLIGALIMLVIVLSFVLNRKSLLAQISFYWCFVGFLLLGVVGLGSTYNEMALYISYFSWSKIILILMLFNKLIKKDNTKVFILSSLSALLFIINIYTLLEMANKLSVNYPPLF